MQLLSLKENAQTFSALNIFVSVLRVGTLILAAIWIDKSEFSPWILVQALGSYHVVLSLGILPALNRELPLLVGSGRKHRYQYILSSGIRFHLWGLFLFVVLSLVMLFSSASMKFIGLGAILAVLRSINALVTAVHLSTLSYNRVSMGLFVHAIGLALGNLLLWYKPGFNILCCVIFAAQISQFIAAAGCAVISRALSIHVRHRARAIKHLILQGVPLTIGATVGALLVTGDRWVAKVLLEQGVFEDYVLPAIIASGLALIQVTALQAMFPKVAITRGSVKSIWDIRVEVIRMVVVMVAAMLLYAGFVIIILPFAVQAFLPQYKLGLGGAVWIALAGLPLSFGVVASQVLRLLKGLWWFAALQSAGFVVAVGIEFCFAVQDPTVLSLCRGVFFGFIAYATILVVGATLRCAREHDSNPI